MKKITIYLFLLLSIGCKSEYEDFIKGSYLYSPYKVYEFCSKESIKKPYYRDIKINLKENYSTIIEYNNKKKSCFWELESDSDDIVFFNIYEYINGSKSTIMHCRFEISIEKKHYFIGCDYSEELTLGCNVIYEKIDKTQ